MTVLEGNSFTYQSTSTDFVQDKATIDRPWQWNICGAVTFGNGSIPQTGAVTFVQGNGFSYIGGTVTTPIQESYLSVALTVPAFKGFGIALWNSATQVQTGGSPHSQLAIFGIATNGTILVFRSGGVLGNGDSGGVLLATSPNNSFTPNVRFVIEIHSVIAPSTGGSVQVNVNGTAVANLTLSSINTSQDGNSVFDSVTIGGHPSPADCQGLVIDSFVLQDHLGSFLGPGAMYGLFPKGPGTTTQFSPIPNTNANWQNVSQRYDADSTYNSSNAAGNIDNFGIATLASGVVPSFVLATVTQRQDSAGSLSLSTYANLSGSISLGTAVVGSTTYATQKMVLPTNPAGGTWTYSNVSALLLGYKEVV